MEVCWRRTAATGGGERRAFKRRSFWVDPRKEEEEALCLKRSEEKESGLSLDLGVEELIGTARRECENLVAVKDIFYFFCNQRKKPVLRMWLWKENGTQNEVVYLYEYESEINVGNRGGDYKGVRHGDNRLVCFVGAFAYV